MQQQISNNAIRSYNEPDTQKEEEQNIVKEILLTICLDGGYEYITQIWIFNKDKSVAAEPFQYGNDSAMRHFYLFPGHYYIRLEINAQIEDNEVELVTDTTYFIGDPREGLLMLNTPKLYTSALLTGAAIFETSPPYYLNAAVGISAKSTFVYSARQQVKSGIFIFLRYPSAEIYRSVNKGKNYWKTFSLQDAEGKTVCKFPDHAITDQTENLNLTNNTGFLGFSAELLPGLYFLKFSGKNKRQIPIYVYQGWYSQFFMTVAKEPLFGTIRIFLSKSKRFEPSNKYHLFVDICLNKIQNEDYTIDQGLLSNIAYGKFDSPMLGLLGAYIYLKSKETKNDDLFRQIVNNLQNKILINSDNAPDIWALNLLAYEHFNETFTSETRPFIGGTPTLRIAFDTIKRAASKYQWLIPKGSLNDLIVEKQIVDSPYNTFEPINFKVLNNNNLLISRDIGRESSQVSFFEPESLSTLETRNTRDNNRLTLKNALDINNIDSFNFPKISFVVPKRVLVSKVLKPTKQEYYQQLLQNPKKLGWVGCNIVNEIIKNDSVGSDVIADRLNLPINTVERIREHYQI